MTNLKRLSKAATPGVWGQFSPTNGPWMSEAIANYQGGGEFAWDTSHDMSAVIDGKPKRLSEWRHAADAAFAEALVNAYRNGDLIEKTTGEDT